MRHRFEIEDEIERVEPHTYVHDDYASSWEYTEARRNRAYQSCLRCFLGKSKEEMLKEKLAPNMTRYLAVFQKMEIPQAYGISGTGKLVLIGADGMPFDGEK